ncbi:glycosyltransferase family 4 protein [Cellulomonas sp. Root137]|uniref:glycosyltransferase family 4 protein n=1 Tax=Cellulomonas sp. Root137 TaxID=1736459 RepID=UPI0006FB2428|nr:glycosyltransferase family 4 protein [Cellulomonas sp. Root137]KQY42920.1 glycosyl transferase family 1 [Cellulomonas sp. Root137]
MRPPRVLIIVQNLPVPLDRRVWLEAQALTAAGYEVSVICPKGPGDPARQVLDGVGIYKYRPAPEANGLLGFVVEFAYSWLRTALLSVVVRRERGFDVIQACNPPDTYWLLALLWRVAGVRFVFDHHDLNPELFRSRFGEPRSAGARAQYAGLLWLERRTFRAAHRVISTNESYRRVALERGGVPREHTEVVRSGPDTRRMRPVVPESDRARGGHLLAYLGIMGPQDDVHVVLEVMDELVRVRGRRDVRAALLGFGDTLEDLRRQCTALGLDDVVEFTGRVGPREIGDYLSAASVGVGPDRNTPLNDASTMNKTMEYMAYAVPAVSFDLTETRFSAGDTGVIVPSGDVGAFADAVEALLDDEDRRVALSLAARERAVAELDWRPQRRRYLGVFDGLLGFCSTVPSDDPAPDSKDPWGRAYVDLEAPGALESFVRSRGPAR